MLEQLSNEITNNYKVKVEIVSKDLSIKSAPQEIFEFCKSNNLNITILINNENSRKMLMPRSSSRIISNSGSRYPFYLSRLKFSNPSARKLYEFRCIIIYGYNWSREPINYQWLFAFQLRRRNNNITVVINAKARIIE